MYWARWLFLSVLIGVATLGSSAQASSRLMAHLERLKGAWQSAERVGNLSAARVLCHFGQARRSANKLLASFARKGDIDGMQLLIDMPLLDFNAVLGIAAKAGQAAAMELIIRQGGDELDLNATLALAASSDDDDKALNAVRYLVEQQLVNELEAAEQIAHANDNYQTAQYLHDARF